MDDRDELLARLTHLVSTDPALVLQGWEHLVLVTQIDAGTPDMTGFCYTADGRAVPVSPSAFEIFDVIEALRTSMAETDGGPPWLAAKVHIDRASGKLDTLFEYADPERWHVTPGNVQQRAREFAP